MRESELEQCFGSSGSVSMICILDNRFCDDFSEKRRMFSIRGREGSSSSLLAEDSPSVSRRSRGGSYILHMEPSVSLTSVSVAFGQGFYNAKNLLALHSSTDLITAWHLAS